jgi:hypothetical protein
MDATHTATIGSPAPRELADQLLARAWADDTHDRERLLLEQAARTITHLVEQLAAADRSRATGQTLDGIAASLVAGDRDIEHAVDQAVAALVAWQSWPRWLRLAYPQEARRIAKRAAGMVIDLVHDASKANATNTRR